MTKEVEIEALKPFNRTPQGDTCDVGDRFTVTENRAEQLVRGGLAKPAEQAAPKPANKAGPKPANKG